MVYLQRTPWARAVLVTSTLALSCRHGTSLLSRVRTDCTSHVVKLCSRRHQQQIRLQLPYGDGRLMQFSPVTRLRGGDQTATALVTDDSNERKAVGTNGDGIINGMLKRESEFPHGGAGANEVGDGIERERNIRRFLAVSEHDRQISALALPALLSLLVDPILSLVDTAYVGRGLGAISLAALGPCTSIFHFSFNTFRSLTQSTTALVGKSLAAGDKKQAGQIVQQMYMIALVLGGGLQVALLTQAPAILGLMGASRGTPLFAEASGYLKIRALAAPAVLLIMVSEGVFRGHADTRAPAVAALSAAVANIILDPIFMFALSMGVSGAAGATAIAQYLAVLLYGGMLWRGARGGRMAVPFFAPRGQGRGREGAETGDGRSGGDEDNDGVGVLAVGGAREPAPGAWSLLVTVVSANAAMLLRTTSLMACWAVATAVATRMSSAAVGAHQVALSLWLLFALVAEAPSIAAQVLGARHIAQGKLETARSMARRVATLTLACSGVLATVLLSLSAVIPRGFTSDPEVLRRLHRLVPLLAFQQPLVAVTLVAEGLLVGAGEFRWLGTTTVCSSALAAWFILMVGSRAPALDVMGVWGGITAMFVGRLLAAAWRIMDRKRGPYWASPQSPSSESHSSQNQQK